MRPSEGWGNSAGGKTPGAYTDTPFQKGANVSSLRDLVRRLPCRRLKPTVNKVPSLRDWAHCSRKCSRGHQMTRINAQKTIRAYSRHSMTDTKKGHWMTRMDAQKTIRAYSRHSMTDTKKGHRMTMGAEKIIRGHSCHSMMKCVPSPVRRPLKTLRPCVSARKKHGIF